MSILSKINNNVNFSVEVYMFRLGPFGILCNSEKVKRILSLENGILSFGDYSYYCIYSEENTTEELLSIWGVDE